MAVAALGLPPTERDWVSRSRFERAGLARRGSLRRAETVEIARAVSAKPAWAYQRVYDAVIANLVAAGLWDKMGFFIWYAAHDEAASRVAWKTPANALAGIAGAPVFTIGRGWVGDATSAAIISGQFWNTVPGATQNNSHFGAYLHFGGTNAGAAVGLSGANAVSLGRSTALASTRHNTTTLTTIGVLPGAMGTHIIVNRNAAAGYDVWVDGALVGSPVVASIAPPAAPIAALVNNTNFAPNTCQVRMQHAGPALTEGEIATLRGIIQGGMAALGAS